MATPEKHGSGIIFVRLPCTETTLSRCLALFLHSQTLKKCIEVQQHPLNTLIFNPSFRNDYQRDKNLLNQSAVLLLLYLKKDTPHFVLMKRSSKLRTHRGQISFPGGQKDKLDASYYHTALRETFEELGVDQKHIQLLGKLTPLYIPVSNFMVHPFIAYTDSLIQFTPNNEEVEEVIELPITKLLDSHSITKEVWEKKGKTFCRPFFDFYGYKVWGATAMILSEFRELLLSK